ncbi:protein of unknown function [Methylocaldum szegediense]|uniref:Uncharacterized protein n=1 Tax=Methylocaldum szegediense TaxID=73780 RepID=A0ABN8X182_9GAMM|nr:protein of unknown function [Methylocaldum szegediense]
MGGPGEEFLGRVSRHREPRHRVCAVLRVLLPCHTLELGDSTIYIQRRDRDLQDVVEIHQANGASERCAFPPAYTL